MGKPKLSLQEEFIIDLIFENAFFSQEKFSPVFKDLKKKVLDAFEKENDLINFSEIDDVPIDILFPDNEK